MNEQTLNNKTETNYFSDELSDEALDRTTGELAFWTQPSMATAKQSSLTTKAALIASVEIRNISYTDTCNEPTGIEQSSRIQQLGLSVVR